MVFRSNPLIQSGQFAELASGIRLHYASCGDPQAPLLMMLHGFPQFWFAWHDLMPRLADRFHVVAPDMRGYNLSDKPTGLDHYRMPFLVADIVDLIDSLGHGQARIVAHDWGGMVAWAAALARPDKVRALMILNAPHPVPFARMLSSDPRQQAASRYMNKLRQPGYERELLANNCAGFERFFRAPGFEDWYTESAAAQYRTAWLQPGAAVAALNYYRASPMYPPQGRDAGAAALALNAEEYHLSIPVRILWGMRDSALHPALLDGLQDLVADLEIHRLNEATHWLHHEQPEVVGAHMDRFAKEFADD